jgi:hypothetical protein
MLVVVHNVLAAGRGNEMLSESVDRYLLRRPVVTHLVVAGVRRPARRGDGNADAGVPTSISVKHVAHQHISR